MCSDACVADAFWCEQETLRVKLFRNSQAIEHYGAESSRAWVG